jgi:hypothetical protein
LDCGRGAEEQRFYGVLPGRADVAPTMEWLVENLLVDELKARLGDEVLLAEPIVHTLDEGAVRRCQRRVLVS